MMDSVTTCFLKSSVDLFNAYGTAQNFHDCCGYIFSDFTFFLLLCILCRDTELAMPIGNH